MRVLIDILHPAHVHVFRNLAANLTGNGHDVLFTLRDKDRTEELMRAYGLEYQLLSRQQTGASLITEFVQRTLKLAKITARYRPHFMLGVMGPSIATVSRMRRMLLHDDVRTMILYGTEMAKITNWFAYPMANYVCTPDSYTGKVMGNHITFPSYLSMSYLSPNRFAPDPAIPQAAGIDTNSPYFVVRFVSYEASHDLGTDAISINKKLDLIRMLETRGRVLITSEKPLPPELERYRISTPVEHIHHIIAFATALVGESATMASECAVLGTAAYYISPIGRGFTNEQEARYSLVTNFTGEKYHTDWVETIRAHLDSPGRAQEIQDGHTRLLLDKVDLTDWMIDFLDREYATFRQAT